MMMMMMMMMIVRTYVKLPGGKLGCEATSLNNHLQRHPFAHKVSGHDFAGGLYSLHYPTHYEYYGNPLAENEPLCFGTIEGFERC